MIDTKDIQPTDFVSIYKDIAEVIGIEATMKLHDNFQGQQLVLPKKLYTKDFIVKSIKQKAESRKGGGSKFKKNSITIRLYRTLAETNDKR